MLTPMQMAVSLKLASSDPDTVAGDGFEKKLETIEKSGAGLAALFPNPAKDAQIGVGEALLFSNSDVIQKECLTEGNDRLATRL